MGTRRLTSAGQDRRGAARLAGALVRFADRVEADHKAFVAAVPDATAPPS